MRILHTESSLGWGGQEIRVLGEARGVARRGHEVALAAPPQARIFAEAPGYGVEVIALPIARKGLAGLSAVRSLLNARAFDVLNTHSSTDSWLGAVACSMRSRAPALVRTRHISAPAPRNFATRWLYGRAARIATTGEKLRAQVIAETGVEPRRVVSIPTGIDLARFQPRDRNAARDALGLPRQAMLVGIVATLRSWKGHEHLYRALAATARADLLLVVVGDGPQRAALEALARTLGIEARVRMMGNQADVAPWMNALDVFCLPSYANEGVPQALAQAMASGLPVVTTPVGSITELVDDGRSGVLVPPSDPAALRSALEALLADAPRRAALGRAAAEHARAHLGEDAMVDAMIALFAAALAERG
jgi:glycosyltransferase involved in cell wall biosynthesis